MIDLIDNEIAEQEKKPVQRERKPVKQAVNNNDPCSGCGVMGTKSVCKSCTIYREK